MKMCSARAAWAHSSIFHLGTGISAGGLQELATAGMVTNRRWCRTLALRGFPKGFTWRGVRHTFGVTLAYKYPIALFASARFAGASFFSHRPKPERAASHVPAAHDDTPSSTVCNALPRTHRARRPVLSYRVAGSAPAKRGRYNCGQFNGQYRRDGAPGRLARDYPAV